MTGRATPTRSPVILGIDPGKTGGAALVARDRTFVAGLRMPTIKVARKRVVVDLLQLDAWLGLFTADALDAVVVEQVGAMPGQGSVSGFTFGRMTGAVEAWACSKGCPVHWVTPAAWKRALHLGPDKQASLDKARLTFGQNPLFEKKANDGIAEAALLAYFFAERVGFGG